MRLLIEIIIIITSVIVIFVLSEERDKKRNDNSRLKDSIEVLNNIIDDKQYQNDSIREKEDSLENQIKDLKEIPRQVESRYKDSIEQVKKSTLSELIGDSSKIVKHEDTTYALVEEKDYRRLREDQLEMKKLKKLCGIYQNQIHKQDSLLKLKNMRIDNYKNQVSIYKNKTAQQEKIIKNQEEQIARNKEKIDRQKWHKRILIGGGAVIAILSIL